MREDRCLLKNKTKAVGRNEQYGKVAKHLTYQKFDSLLYNRCSRAESSNTIVREHYLHLTWRSGCARGGIFSAISSTASAFDDLETSSALVPKLSINTATDLRRTKSFYSKVEGGRPAGLSVTPHGARF